MKFICLGCLDKEAWERLGADEQAALVLACTNFDQELAAHGHFAAGYALQDSATATTVRWAGGMASRTDGPFAETKEMLGGILVLEAKDKAAMTAVRMIPNTAMAVFRPNRVHNPAKTGLCAINRALGLLKRVAASFMSR